MSTLEDLVDAYHHAARDFAKGNSESVKRLFTHREDVVLANPFGPAVRGWQQVSRALDFAAARMRDGDVTSFERVANYETPDLASVVEVEHWKAKVSGRQEVLPFDLRVTSTFRREDGAWKIVHRHADPIATPNQDGPLRAR